MSPFSLPRSFSRYTFLALSLAISLVPQLVLAQSSPPTPPTHKPPAPPPPPPAVDQEQFISYWTTETGWRTELQLRNNAAAQDLTVTPALRLPDGSETSLAAVTIKPQEVKSINLDAAIPADAPQLIGAYGSVVLRYRAPAFSALYAVAMVMGVGHSIAFHIDGTGELQEEEAGSREGIWWLPSSSASDYLVLVNKAQNPLALSLSLFDASGKASTQRLALAPAATSRLSIRQLVAAARLTGSYGGFTISARDHRASLNTLHVLFDQNAGFSAILKMFDHAPNPKLSERDFAKTGVWTLRAPMLALSIPDPALAFPVGTVLKPQIFVRNASGKPVDAALRFNWRGPSGTGKAAGPQLHLLPYETRLIDVAALQDATVLRKEANWASVTITSNALPDELVAVASSYDTTLKYGAQTPFSDQLSHQWKGGMFEYDPQHNSIITAGNGGTKPTQAAFTIFYNQGSQKYELEQTLQPDEQMWIDIGKLVHENVPDKTGKTLPADLTVGSYEFRDLTNTGVGTLFEGKVIYDKTYGHVTYGCATCCGYNAAAPWYDPVILDFLGPVGDDGVYGYNVCDQQWEDVSNIFYGGWSSSDTSIVTVDYYGTQTPQDVGSTNSCTAGYLEGTAHYPLCPQKRFPVCGGDNVTPKILLGGVGGTDITNTTQSVVVGQQIVLYAAYQDGLTVNNQSWSVPGTNIAGGFATALTNGGPTPVTLNGRTTTFYWTAAATSQTVTFTLNYGSNQIATAQATFNISAPTSVGVATQLNQVVITSEPALSLGIYPSTAGIQFTASATPPTGYSNTFEWVQIITNDTKVITRNNNSTTTCVPATTPAGGLPFLDNGYPYDTSNPTTDIPETVLDSTQFKELTRNFSATMYLLWKPGLQNSIFVPLGSVSWQWSGDALYNAGNQTWTLNSSSKSANAFSASSTYPTWSRYSDYSNPCQQ